LLRKSPEGCRFWFRSITPFCLEVTNYGGEAALTASRSRHKWQSSIQFYHIFGFSTTSYIFISDKMAKEKVSID
jgi:hypothetical protein